jgi:2'-5' RNA ligase
MSYFVGYMLEGAVAEWHREVAKNISEHFGTWKVHEKVAPHLTIFYPFDTEEVDTLSNLLEGYCEAQAMPGTISVTDFGRFDDNVVFAKAEAGAEINAVVHELQDLLSEVPLVPRRGFRAWNPHATLAHKVPKETMHKIWEYVQTLPKPHFILDFDNITLFRYEGERKWSVEKIFRFGRSGV